MSRLKIWIQAARLRTLPLSFSGILLGNAWAYTSDHFSYSILIFSILTTLALQVLSNFANDYGDGIKGTDNEDRIGPKRVMQQNLISPQKFKRSIFITAIIAFLLSILLMVNAFGKQYPLYYLIFIILSLASIFAAIYYTVGKNAYGYKGLGDVFVFIFFGVIAVFGSYFMQTKYLNFTLVFPMLTVGSMCVAVLNLNNMRDMDSDRKAGKKTIAMRLGFRNAKLYHYGLLTSGVSSAILSFVFNYKTEYAFVFSPFLLVIFYHFIKVLRTKHNIEFDSQLKVVALTLFFFSLSFFIFIQLY